MDPVSRTWSLVNVELIELFTRKCAAKHQKSRSTDWNFGGTCCKAMDINCFSISEDSGKSDGWNILNEISLVHNFSRSTSVISSVVDGIELNVQWRRFSKECWLKRKCITNDMLMKEWGEKLNVMMRMKIINNNVKFHRWQNRRKMIIERRKCHEKVRSVQILKDF